MEARQPSSRPLGPCAAMVVHSPRWARFLLIACPAIVIIIQGVGLLMDGCRRQRYLSDTMNEVWCLHEAEGDQAVPRASAHINRWLIWHYFFLCELLKRVVYLPKSTTRNVFIVMYVGNGLCAMYAFEGWAHVVFGTVYMLTGVTEVSVLWYPCCGPPLGPCCPACCRWICCRPGSGCCGPQRRRRREIAIFIYIWIHGLALIYTLATPILGLRQHIVLFGRPTSPGLEDEGGVRLDVVLEWTLVLAFQAIHWFRAPALAAAKYSVEARPMLSDAPEWAPTELHTMSGTTERAEQRPTGGAVV